jgi:hypothetical protein
MAKKRKTIPLQAISLKSYIIDRARKLPFYKCWSIGDDLSGMKQIVVSRQKANGNIIVGFYLIDYFCLGLKDTFYREFEDEGDLNDTFFSSLPDEVESKEIDSDYAQNFIYGAIEYAEDLGFEPAKDFRITEYILDDVAAIEYIEITFGEDGMPHYMAGEDDDIDKNLKILRENVGIDNFHYTNLTDIDDEDYEDEMDDLDAMDEDEFIEKAEETIAGIEDEQVKALFIFHFGILLNIQEIWDNFDELIEKYKANKDALVVEIQAKCIEEDKSLEPIFDGDKDNKILLILIEQYMYHEVIHFILDSDYQKALESFINKSRSPEQFHLLTTMEDKMLIWGMVMLEQISQFLFKIDSFEKLNTEQKDRTLSYFLVEINKEEASMISEEYQNLWEDFTLFNEEYYAWNEDELKQKLLAIGQQE